MLSSSLIRNAGLAAVLSLSAVALPSAAFAQFSGGADQTNSVSGNGDNSQSATGVSEGATTLPGTSNETTGSVTSDSQTGVRSGQDSTTQACSGSGNVPGGDDVQCKQSVPGTSN